MECRNKYLAIGSSLNGLCKVKRLAKAWQYLRLTGGFCILHHRNVKYHIAPTAFLLVYAQYYLGAIMIFSSMFSSYKLERFVHVLLVVLVVVVTVFHSRERKKYLCGQFKAPLH